MISDVLCAKAAEVGMSRKDIAIFLGITDPTLRRWLRGETEPKPRFEQRVYEFLSLDPSQAVKRKRPGPKPSPLKQQAIAQKVAELAERRLLASQRRKARAMEMIGLYRDGQTLEQIGQLHGITRERVRQLMLEFGVTGADGGSAVRSARTREAKLQQLEEKYVARYGMPRSEYLAIPSKARRAYIQQRKNAVDRCIGWQISIREWWGVWQQSGKWEQRGRGYGYVMARHGDSGPYEVGNVYICTGAQNASDSYQWKPAADRVAKRRQKMQATA